MMSLEKSQGLGHGLNKKQGGQRHSKRGGFQGVMTPALLAKAFRQVLPADPFLPDDVFTCDAGARGFPPLLPLWYDKGDACEMLISRTN